MRIANLLGQCMYGYVVPLTQLNVTFALFVTAQHCWIRFSVSFTIPFGLCFVMLFSIWYSFPPHWCLWLFFPMWPHCIYFGWVILLTSVDFLRQDREGDKELQSKGNSLQLHITCDFDNQILHLLSYPLLNQMVVWGIGGVVVQKTGGCKLCTVPVFT